MKGRPEKMFFFVYCIYLFVINNIYLAGASEGGHDALECSTDSFHCDTTLCVPKEWACDNHKDCENGADEIGCNITCKNSEFQCKNDDCINVEWLCDGEPDCVDGEDEEQCQTTCDDDQFRCTNGRCIDLSWHCDQDDDCSDQSDEKDCPPSTCAPKEFSCNDTGRCIPGSYTCDGDQDCADGSDESDKLCQESLSSQKSACSEAYQFTCDNKICIAKSWECDGYPDCSDKSDEHDQCDSVKCGFTQFSCANKQECILGVQECDGNPDCSDNSDEKNCGETVQKCDEHTEFDCFGNNIYCVDVSKVCDKKNDCPDGEDEVPSLCNADDPCEDNNGGCDHYCSFNYAASVCSCRAGYKLENDGKTCKNIDECQEGERGLCSHTCIDTEAGYRCECQAGYSIDPHRKNRCKADGPEPLLLFADRMDVRTLGLHSLTEQSVVGRTRSATAIDYDTRLNTVYWSDVALEMINKTQLNGSDDAAKTDIVVKDFIKTPDGLAFDWIHKNLYWSDTGRNTIEVINVNSGHRSVVFNTNLDEPRALVLDPRDNQRWMYWTDWGTNPRIEKAGLDGSHRKPLVTEGIQWANGLTIDYVTDQLFWVDAKKFSISTCDLHGQRPQVLIVDPININHPFAITVFEDNLYWSDWISKGIHTVNKFTGKEVQKVVSNLYSPMDLHVYHHLKQPDATDNCGKNNGGCSHLCLPAPFLSAGSAVYTCRCPENSVLRNDQRTCNTSDAERPAAHPRTTRPTSTSTKNPTGKGIKALPNTSDDGQHVGKIAGVIAGILTVIAIIATLIGFFVYRSYNRRNIRSMNFDNPVYRKTTEDQFSLEKHQYQPSKTLPPTLEPLTSSSNELV